MDAIVSWLCRSGWPSADSRPPAVADEPVLERELGRIGRHALAFTRADDDELERALRRVEAAQLREPGVEILACRSQVAAHGADASYPVRRRWYVANA